MGNKLITIIKDGSMLCSLGLHRWVDQRILEWRMTHVTGIMNGDKCERCGKIKQNIEEITKGLPQDYVVL